MEASKDSDVHKEQRRSAIIVEWYQPDLVGGLGTAIRHVAVAMSRFAKAAN